MEICFDSLAKNRCYKLPKKTFEKLNIVHSGKHLLLWNRFHLFAYNFGDLAEKPAFLELDFEIKHIFITKNEFYCMDKEGTSYIIMLTDFSQQRKYFKKIPNDTAEVYLGSSQINEEIAVILSCDKSGENFSIRLKKLNPECKLLKKYSLTTIPSSQEKVTFIKGLYCYCSEDILKYFNSNVNAQQKNYIVFYSLDSRTVFVNVINLLSKQSSLTPNEVYHCPSVFNDVCLSENQNKILIILQSGTLLILNLCVRMQLQTVHLCTGVHKAILHENNLYFSDKITLWKLSDVFNSVNRNRKFEKLKLKLPNDFKIIEDKFVCISFSNILYCFNNNSTDNFEDKCNELSEYVTQKDITQSKEIIKSIISEVEKKETVDLNIRTEKCNTLAVALTTKRNVLERYLSVQIKSFQNYREIIAETDTYTQIANINEYLKDIVIFAIKIAFLDIFKNKLIEIAKVVKEQIQIHVTIKNSVFSTTNSLPINKNIHQDFSVLIPITKSNGLPSKMIIQIIVPIKNTFGNGYFWPVLYSKTSTIGAEHFINTNLKYDQKISLVESKLNIGKVNEIAKQYAGLLVDFDIPMTSKAEEFKTSLKLSKNFEDKINENNLKKYCTTSLGLYLAKNLNNDFLKLKQNVTLTLEGSSANLKIEKDYNSVFLRISSNSRNTCLSLKDFFDRLINDEINDQVIVIDHKEYAKMENLRRSIKEAINSSNKSGIEKGYEQFLEFCAELGT